MSAKWGRAVSIMHELGHNLNLDHGPDEPTNYTSIMNYLYSDEMGNRSKL